MRARAKAALVALPAISVMIAAGSSAGSDSGGDFLRAAAPIHIRGVAYSFDNQDPIAGALIRVAELPGARARTRSNGSYDLAVPDGTKVTPYIEAEGYHGIYLQTFVTQGRDLARVNFQIPTTGTYHALAALLDVPLDENDDPARCVVVSTLSTKKIRNLSFDQFIAYGAHGVAGATASAEPRLPKPIYFNENVIPDRSLTESSVDGGVIWLKVPRGVYRFTADHPSTRFASFVATCEPGRLVNANPPQGLYELRRGEPADNSVAAGLASVRFGPGDRVLRLRIAAAEYVLPEATLLRGGKLLAHERPARFAPGPRALALAIPGSVAPGAVRLRLTIEDGAGNHKLVERRLRVQ